VWRAGFGRTIEPEIGADGNGDGVVDAADYVVWRKNLGMTLPAGNAAFQQAAPLEVSIPPALGASAFDELTPATSSVPADGAVRDSKSSGELTVFAKDFAFEQLGENDRLRAGSHYRSRFRPRFEAHVFDGGHRLILASEHDLRSLSRRNESFAATNRRTTIAPAMAEALDWFEFASLVSRKASGVTGSLDCALESMAGNETPRMSEAEAPPG
jgi:hypothetical protein